MTTFRIIEDCSPFFVKFTYDGFEEDFKLLQDNFDKNNIINWQDQTKVNKNIKKHVFSYNATKDDPELCQFLAENNKCAKLFNLVTRGYHMTGPGGGGIAHLDRNRLGVIAGAKIFYVVEMPDDKCITSWFNNDNLVLDGRFVIDATAPLPAPVVSTTMRSTEAVLFNTGIFHDWWNHSDKDRTVLNFYEQDPVLTFDEMKSKLFGNTNGQD